MICFPNAKINLGLNIVSKREDGYHNLETVFYPINIQDALEIILSKSGEDSFIESGLKVDSSSDDNLVMKALRVMRESFSIPPLEVHLLKKIPFGAGIGGGSADASFMLRLLNDTFNLGATNEKMADMASKLGADCPFFIYNRPMFASGIGEKLEDIEVSLSEYKIVLVKPDVHIPTKDAFALIKPSQPEVSLKEIVKLSVEEWKYLIKNDFESSIFPKYPIIEQIKNQLYELGASYVSMSGSGSSVYALFKQPIDLNGCFDGCYVWNEK